LFLAVFTLAGPEDKKEVLGQPSAGSNQRNTQGNSDGA